MGNHSLAPLFGESSANKDATVGIRGLPRPSKGSSSNSDPMHLGAVFKWVMHPLKYDHASCVPLLLRYASHAP